MRAALLVAALYGLIVSAQCSTVVFVDSKSHEYIKEGAPVKLDSQSLSSLLSALTGLLPAYEINHQLSSTIQRVLQPSPFRKPKAHVILNLAGAFPEEVISAFHGRRHREVDVRNCEAVANTVTEATAAAVAANPDVRLTLLDQEGLQACANNCLDEYLTHALEAVGGRYLNAQQKVELSGSVSLDASKPADKLFAVELASAYSGLQQLLQSPPTQDIVLYEVTLLGLQGLAQAYGEDSAEFQAGKAAVMALVRQLIQQLDELHVGDITYTLSAFDGVPTNGGGLTRIMEWKESSRRQLADSSTTTVSNSSFPGPDEANLAKLFSTKAVGYGGFILLLYFSLGAVYCMCNMPFKQDTLLYGRPKAD